MMAKFYRDASGEYGLRHGLSIDFPIPAGAEIVEFDEAANPELIHALTGGVLWQDLAINRGQITHKGEPLTINPPEPVKPTAEQELLEWAKHLRAKMQAATTFDDLKTEDAKHPPLPEKADVRESAELEVKAG